MNNSQVIPNLWRLFGVLLLQLVLFKPISEVLGPYFNIFIWPLFILYLPIQMGTPLVVFFGFVSGLLVDMIYATPGIHASAGAFAGYIRPMILGAFEPKGGFSGKEPIASPEHFGWVWFAQVSGLFLILFLFWLFSVDAFTFFYFGTIALKSLSSFALSMLFLVIFTFLVKPKN